MGQTITKWLMQNCKFKERKKYTFYEYKSKLFSENINLRKLVSQKCTEDYREKKIFFLYDKKKKKNPL